LIQARRDFFHASLLQYGTVLLRGFDLRTIAKFERFVRVFSGKDFSITRAEFRRAAFFAAAFTLRPNTRRISRSPCTTNCRIRTFHHAIYIFSVTPRRWRAAQPRSAIACGFCAP
jgi:homogentisate 1,2-dioxygenase